MGVKHLRTHSPPIDKAHERHCRMLLLVIHAHRQHAIWLGIIPASQLLWSERAIWLLNEHRLSLPLEQG